MINSNKNVQEQSLFNKKNGRGTDKSPSKNAANSAIGEYQNEFVVKTQYRRNAGSSLSGFKPAHGMSQTPSLGFMGTAYGGQSRTDFDNQSSHNTEPNNYETNINMKSKGGLGKSMNLDSNFCIDYPTASETSQSHLQRNGSAYVSKHLGVNEISIDDPEQNVISVPTAHPRKSVDYDRRLKFAKMA